MHHRADYTLRSEINDSVVEAGQEKSPANDALGSKLQGMKRRTSVATEEMRRASIANARRTSTFGTNKKLGDVKKRPSWDMEDDDDAEGGQRNSSRRVAFAPEVVDKGMVDDFTVKVLRILRMTSLQP